MCLAVTGPLLYTPSTHITIAACQPFCQKLPPFFWGFFLYFFRDEERGSGVVK